MSTNKVRTAFKKFEALVKRVGPHEALKIVMGAQLPEMFADGKPKTHLRFLNRGKN